MKLIDTTCPKCGANLHIDAECQSVFCEYCGGQILIDDEVQHLQIDNAENAGYAFEKGQKEKDSVVDTRLDVYFPDAAHHHNRAEQKTENRNQDWHYHCRLDCLSADRYRLGRG